MTVYSVYIIEAENGKLYTGIALDPEARFEKHRTGSGAKFFRSSPPKRLVYVEEQPDKSSALRREIEIKRMTRAQKLALIKEYEDVRDSGLGESQRTHSPLEEDPDSELGSG